MIALPFALTKTVQMWLWAGAAVVVAAFVYSYVEGERDQREARVRGQIAETTRQVGEDIQERTDEIYRTDSADDVRGRLRTGQFAVGALPRVGAIGPGVDGGGSAEAGRGLGATGDGRGDQRQSDLNPGVDGVWQRSAGDERSERESVFEVELCRTIRARIMKDTADFERGCTK